VKEFKGKPDVFVVSEPGIIGVTTSEHMKVEQIPLDQYLKQVIEEGRKYGDSIVHKYDYPDGEWFPCGTANLVLRWNQHREIIDLFRKTSAEGRKGRNDFWTGWFGRLMKTSSQGWWWTPPMWSTQAMKFQEEVCRFIREKLIFKNIKVDVRTYID